jgi:hypothetical protein
MPEIPMPQVDLTDATFKRLQRLARPLIDSTSDVVDRLIDHYERTHDAPAAEPAPGEIVAALKFDPANLPPLTHTKLRSASIAGKQIDRPSWNELVRAALELAFARAGSFEELRRLTDARIVKGIKTDEGYSPLGSLGFSVQGVDAQDAFRIVYGIVRKLAEPVEVFFEWRDKENAAHPGDTGTIAWSPSPR